MSNLLTVSLLLAVQTAYAYDPLWDPILALRGPLSVYMGNHGPSKWTA